MCIISEPELRDFCTFLEVLKLFCWCIFNTGLGLKKFLKDTFCVFFHFSWCFKNAESTKIKKYPGLQKSLPLRTVPKVHGWINSECTFVTNLSSGISALLEEVFYIFWRCIFNTGWKLKKFLKYTFCVFLHFSWCFKNAILLKILTFIVVLRNPSRSEPDMLHTLRVMEKY